MDKEENYTELIYRMPVSWFGHGHTMRVLSPSGGNGCEAAILHFHTFLLFLFEKSDLSPENRLYYQEDQVVLWAVTGWHNSTVAWYIQSYRPTLLLVCFWLNLDVSWLATSQNVFITIWPHHRSKNTKVTLIRWAKHAMFILPEHFLAFFACL